MLKPQQNSSRLYRIYPLPQKIVYFNTKFKMTPKINLTIQSNIDVQTKTFLQNTLTVNLLTFIYSQTISEQYTSIMFGVHNSGQYVDQYFKKANCVQNQDIFNKNDGYVLRIDSKQNGVICIIGKDTNAVYHAIATLKIILQNSEEIQTLQIQDYADVKYRGFIQGFYGIPWKHENRIRLMQYGRNYKMNSYIFAPKDDPYHNHLWRQLYPQNQLMKIKDLVRIGIQTKCKFIWAIHPGFNKIKWQKYEEELQKLINKFQQLYQIGIRQFGLFMDDINKKQALAQKQKHLKLIVDAANWSNKKGDCNKLIYCPTYYHQRSSKQYGIPYLQMLAKSPQNVEFIWTGGQVCGLASKQELDWPKRYTKRDMFMWLNWPVNDYKPSRLLLGPGQVMKPGTNNLSGLVTNPMSHSELSKIALFAVSDFTWNTHKFNASQNWKNSFKTIAPQVQNQFMIIASHMCTPQPKIHGLVLAQSQYIKDDLRLFINKIQNEQKCQVEAKKIKCEFEMIVESIVAFKDKIQNKGLLLEIEPWLQKLLYIAKCANILVEASLRLRLKDNYEDYKEPIQQVQFLLKKSQQCYVTLLEGKKQKVEAGSKYLMPFVFELIQILSKKR